MPLIKCKECGVERSNQLGSACPKCGHVIGAEKEAEQKRRIKEKAFLKHRGSIGAGWAFGIIWAISLGLGINSKNRTDEVNEDPKMVRLIGDKASYTNSNIFFGLCIATGLASFHSFSRASKIKEVLDKLE